MEEKPDEVEEIESDSSDSFVAGSDSDVEDEELSSLAQESESTIQEPLTSQEIEEIIEELFAVESKAAEAQEALEKESLAKVANEVREELSLTLQGDDLEAAVEEEMNTFKEEWEATLDDLETESANLLEQLDGAGVDLPKLYKHIESQAPNECYTDAWKRRAHWVGSQMTSDVNVSVTEADSYLKTNRPVQRRHGKMLEEGASGFLQKKLASDGNAEATKGELDWASMRDLFSSCASEDVASFGSKQWASVYLANTPQEAAALGLNLPGVDEVEEIENIDPSSSDPFVADAVANEMQLALSEKQARNYRKVKEEDDAKLDRKLRHRLKKRRSRKRSKQKHSIDQLNKCDEALISSAQRYDELNVIRSGSDDTNKANIDNGHSEWVTESCSEPNLSNAGINIADKNDDDDVEDHKSNLVVIDLDEESTNPVDDCEIDDFNNHPSVQQNLHCTACSRISVVAHTHPLLAVTICEDCRNLLRDRALWKDRESSERYCGWCGLGSDFLTCTTCSFLFCYACIKRNLGEGVLSKAQSVGWRCCSCCPDMLNGLIYPERKATRSLEASISSSDSDTGVSNSFIGAENKRKHKKKIRRILDDAELGEETKKKIALEKERQDRLMSLKEQISEKSNATGSVLYGGGGTEVAGIDILGGATTGYIVNVVREKGEPIVRIPCSISASLKAHQVSGIRFLWENIIQAISKVKSGDKGLGCILAHTMGLGKTFQVVAFLYIAMRCVDLGLKNALIVTPVNVLHNWRKEFFKWKPSESEIKPLRIFMLEDVSRDKRVDLLKKWRRKGGVFLIGYTAFRNLSLGKNIKDRNVILEISSALQDGPDILVCDEAHIIKNTRADTTQALKLVKCQRRIALTGSPLQNNLMEYYCMVDFVREGFLGSSHEFRNRFQNPIENGQHTNSTADDVKIMNQRSHILYEQLKGFVQRMDMSVVKKDLPPKTVFVVGVKLSPLQRKLYKRFLDVHGFRKDEASDVRMRKCFFAGYQALAQIWNHPGILQLRKDKDSSNLDGISDGSSDENIDFNSLPGENQRKPRDSTQRDEADEFFERGWWNDLLHDNNYKEVDYSGKMVLLIDILTMSSNIGDKTLVFSQSIPTLDLIEFYLSRLPRHDKPGSFWKKGRDWFRLDGRTLSSDRQKMVEMFNDPDNRRVKCTLISTRAGSLGINLHAANRVVIVDGSWNPTYDLQAIYRAWRYGQMKPVFAYRLLAHGTMEEKIYKRQVTKEGLAARVVDRQQIHRMISREEMLHLFDFGDEDYSENMATFTHSKKFSPAHGSCSSDKLMETLLAKHSSRWIANHHEHETFLQENEDEKLTKEEQDMAWEVYKRSLEWEEVQRVSHDDRKFHSPDTPVASASPRVDANVLLQSKNMISRRCTKLAHMLTLRSQGVKVGGFTVCGECAQEINWDDLKKI